MQRKGRIDRAVSFPLPVFCKTCLCRRRLGVISEIKSSDWSLLASQRAGVLKSISVAGNSKFRGSNNVWNEERRLTKLLLSRMEKSKTE